MDDMIKKTVQEVFNRDGYEIVFYDIESQTDWDYILLNQSYCSAGYGLHSINYQLAYFTHHDPSFKNSSIIIKNAEGALAIWPISSSRDSMGNEYWHSFGRPIRQPVAIEKYQGRALDKLFKTCISVLVSIASKHGVTYEVMDEFMGELSNSKWYSYIINEFALKRIDNILLINCQLDENKWKSEIRKSYKSLINQSNKLWTCDIYSSVNAEQWEEFRKFHHKISGRITRSKKSWDRQFEMVNNKSAIYMTIRSMDGTLVGSILFETTKNELLYAVAVYERELFDKPIGHLAISKALSWARLYSIKWIRLGYIFDKGQTSISDKQRSISHFLQGFSTNCFAQPVFVLNQ